MQDSECDLRDVIRKKLLPDFRAHIAQLKCTIPIYCYDDQDDPCVLATGTFVRIGDAALLLTANHSVENEFWAKAFLAHGSRKFARPAVLKQFPDPLDIAALSFPENEFFRGQDLNDLPIDNTPETLVPGKNQVALVGFPETRFHRNKKSMKGTAEQYLLICTVKSSEPNRLHLNHHRRKYVKTGTDLKAQAPRLHGVSGGLATSITIANGKLTAAPYGIGIEVDEENAEIAVTPFAAFSNVLRDLA